MIHTIHNNYLKQPSKTAAGHDIKPTEQGETKVSAQTELDSFHTAKPKQDHKAPEEGQLSITGQGLHNLLAKLIKTPLKNGPGW